MQSQDSDWPLPMINPRQCTGCGLCVKGCPTQAVELRGRRAVIVHPESCTFCEVCEQSCPEGAIGRPFMIRFASSE